MSWYSMARSRSAREAILTRYAIFGFERFEKLSRWPGAAMGYIVQSLADAFFGVGAGLNITFY